MLQRILFKVSILVLTILSYIVVFYGVDKINSLARDATLAKLHSGEKLIYVMRA